MQYKMKSCFEKLICKKITIIQFLMTYFAAKLKFPHLAKYKFPLFNSNTELAKEVSHAKGEINDKTRIKKV